MGYKSWLVVDFLQMFHLISDPLRLSKWPVSFLMMHTRKSFNNVYPFVQLGLIHTTPSVPCSEFRQHCYVSRLFFAPYPRLNRNTSTLADKKLSRPTCLRNRYHQYANGTGQNHFPLLACYSSTPPRHTIQDIVPEYVYRSPLRQERILFDVCWSSLRGFNAPHRYTSLPSFGPLLHTTSDERLHPIMKTNWLVSRSSRA